MKHFLNRTYGLMSGCLLVWSNLRIIVDIISIVEKACATSCLCWSGRRIHDVKLVGWLRNSRWSFAVTILELGRCKAIRITFSNLIVGTFVYLYFI